MAIRLTVVDDKEPETEYTQGFVQDRVVMGRAKICDQCLPDMAVSTRHVEIRLDGTEYKAVDLGSLNGTWINGKKLIAHRPRALKNDDILQVVDFSIRFRLGVAPNPQIDRDETTAQARDILASILASTQAESPEPAIVVLAGPSKAARFTLPKEGEKIRIGRSRDVEINLEDRDVSREHAAIIHEGDKFIVRDLRSRNGIIFHGERVEELTLTQGVSFVVGNTTLGMEHPVDVPLSKIQNAPEEETSSFSPSLRVTKNTLDDKKSIAQPKPIDAKTDMIPVPEEQSIQIGPEDPLSYPGQPGYVRTTRELPRPAEDISDLGLIVVGAVIVVAAVAALVWIFG